MIAGTDNQAQPAENPNMAKAYLRPVRIIIAHNYSPASFSVISWSLAQHLASRGHEVLFFSHHPNINIGDTGIANLKVIGWPQKRPTGISSFRHYYKHHQQFKPQLALLHFAPQYIAGVASWMLGCPNRWAYYHTAEEANIADTYQHPLANKLRRWRRSMLYLLIHKVICVSKFAQHDIRRFFSIPVHKLDLVYNALPDRCGQIPLKSSNGPVIFHLLGRMDPCKRMVELALAFMAFLKETGADAILRVAGDGPLTTEFLSTTKGEKKIMYVGRLEYGKVDGFIQQAHFTICPSLVETFGMVNAESLMNGTPVLANSVGGIPEIVIDGYSGFLSKGLDQANWIALFKKTVAFIRDEPQAYLQMQRQCRQHYLDNFSIGKYLSEMTDRIECSSPQ